METKYKFIINDKKQNLPPGAKISFLPEKLISLSLPEFCPPFEIICPIESRATLYIHSPNNSMAQIHLSLEANCHLELATTSLSTQITATLTKNATLNIVIINDKTTNAKNNIEVNLNGQNASASINGLYSLKNEEQADNNITIRHNSPHTESNLYFKGILDDHAYANYVGNIIIEKGSSKSISQQSNKNLLLSSTAHINARPVLEILNDDVKCSHGATVGDINQDELFYLQSRGINKENAKKELTKSINEILNVNEPEKVEIVYTVVFGKWFYQ